VNRACKPSPRARRKIKSAASDYSGLVLNLTMSDVALYGVYSSTHLDGSCAVDSPVGHGGATLLLSVKHGPETAQRLLDRLKSACGQIRLPLVIVTDLQGEHLVNRRINLPASLFGAWIHPHLLRTRIVPSLKETLFENVRYHTALFSRVNRGQDRQYSSFFNDGSVHQDLSGDRAATQKHTSWAVRFYSVDSGLAALDWFNGYHQAQSRYVDLMAVYPTVLLLELGLAKTGFETGWTLVVQPGDSHCRHSLLLDGRVFFSRLPETGDSVADAQFSELRATFHHIQREFPGVVMAELKLLLLEDSSGSIQSTVTERIGDLPELQAISIREIDQFTRWCTSKIVTEQLAAYRKSVLSRLNTLACDHNHRALGKRLSDANCLPPDIKRQRLTSRNRQRLRRLTVAINSVLILLVLFLCGQSVVVYSIYKKTIAELGEINETTVGLQEAVGKHQFDAYAVRASVGHMERIQHENNKPLEGLKAIANSLSDLEWVQFESVSWKTSAPFAAPDPITVDRQGSDGVGNEAAVHYKIFGRMQKSCGTIPRCLKEYQQFQSTLEDIEGSAEVTVIRQPFSSVSDVAHNTAGSPIAERQPGDGIEPSPQTPEVDQLIFVIDVVLRRS